MNFNSVVIAGRLTRNPDLRMTKNGQPVTTVSIATNRVYIDKAGQKQDQVEYHAIVIFGKQAETTSVFLQKGSLALIHGRLATRAWTDKDGITRRSTEIIADNVQFGPKPEISRQEPLIAPVEKEPVEEETIPDLEDDGETVPTIPL